MIVGAEPPWQTVTTVAGVPPQTEVDGGAGDDDGPGPMIVIVLLVAAMAAGLSAVAQRLRQTRPPEP